MTIDILTLFPAMFTGPFDESIVRRAMDKQLVQIHIHNLRQWAIDTRGTVDDKPYGGGVGMVMRPEPIFNAVAALKSSNVKFPRPRRSPDQRVVDEGGQMTNQIQNPKIAKIKTILLDAGGVLYNQKKAQGLSNLEHLILICGHYEGVDFRIHEHLADEVISIGDYVLTGGEIPAMAVVDSIARLIPGVLAKEEATKKESFSKLVETRHAASLLEYPQFTRPEEFQGYKVPQILLSGNHAAIEKWRKNQSLLRTKTNRPDLLI